MAALNLEEAHRDVSLANKQLSFMFVEIVLASLYSRTPERSTDVETSPSSHFYSPGSSSYIEIMLGEKIG